MAHEEFNPVKEAQKFLDTSQFIFQYEMVFEYKSGFYQPCDDRGLLQRISERLNNQTDRSRLTKVKEVLETIKNILSTRSVEVNSNPNIINVKNGWLDIKTMSLSPHGSSPVFMYQVNADYNPEAKCPKFERFLEEVLVDENNYNEPDKELIKVIQHFFGYCFYTGLPLHKALLLYGDGSNGKGILTHPLEALLNGTQPNSQVSHVNFEAIGRDLFATSDLAGKMLNISPELSRKVSLNDGEIKAILAGDPIRAQRKYQRAFEFTPLVKHIICTNNLPTSDDRTFGFFRRFIVVPCHVVFLFESERKEIQDFKSKGRPYRIANPFLKEELREELPGIFCASIKGLRGLLDQKDFPYSRQAEKMKMIFKARSATVEAFADEHFDKENVAASSLLKDAYLKYAKFCQARKFIPESSRGFPDQLRKLGYPVEKGTGGVYYIQGVALQ